LLLPLALASRSARRGLTPRSLPAWTALVSPRNLACRVRHQSNDPVVVQEFQPDVHRSPPVKVRLRPDSPVADHPCDGTLGLPVVGVRTPLLCYSFRHSLSIPLHGGLALPLHHDIDAPLPRRDLRPHILRFGTTLCPAGLSAHRHSTSELLRTLSRVAASKPTSWLSAPRHILYHSASIWGP
jgi:hypothetical protein